MNITIDYGIGQDRKRVFYVGFRKDLDITTFEFPEPVSKDKKKYLKDIIWDLRKKCFTGKRKKQNKWN
nr:DNA cytosine methyltransferase [Fusobacterium necrophorum]